MLLSIDVQVHTSWDMSCPRGPTNGNDIPINNHTSSMKSQGQHGFLFETQPCVIMVAVTSLLVYELAYAIELGVSAASDVDHTSVYALIARLTPTSHHLFLQNHFESYPPQLMLTELKKMFEKPQAVEIYDLVDALHSCKQAPGKSGRENKTKPQANKKDKSKGKTDKNKKVVPYQPKPKHNPLKRKENPNKDQTCHHCHVAGHWNMNSLLYLEELRKNKDKAEHGAAASGNLFTIELFNLTYKLNSFVYDTGCGIYICNTLQGFKEERKLSYGEQYLQVGNRAQAAVEAIGVFDLVLPSGLVLKLNNCYYAPSIVRGVVSLSCLLDLRFNHTIVSNRIFVSLNGLFYFSAISMNELKLGKKIKALCSDRGAEYLSQEFKDYIKSVVRILNMVPTNKVDKTPYEIWHGKAHNLSYLKVWGCEAYVKRDSADKLHQISVKCIFIGYPKETMGYYFYFPPENKVIVARYGNFLERDLISQKFNGRDNDLEDDHMDTLPSKNTSEIPVESKSLGSSPKLIPICRSERTTRVPNHLCLNIEVVDDEVGDLREPANYKAAMLDPDKVVRSKWLYKKKTDMDGKVHTYKARLVAKGCTQTYRVDYEEKFSPVANIRAIRILIAIAAYYDYEIWQTDVKTAFLNVRLDKDIYMEKPEGYVDPKYPNRICKLQRSIYSLKQGLRQWNKRFDEEIKKFGFIQNRDESCVYRKASGSDVVFLILYEKLHTFWELKSTEIDPGEVKHDLSNELCASTPEEVAYMKKVPYASAVAVKHILKYLRNTRDMFLVYGGKPDTELDVTAQAEYVAASEAAIDAVWIRKFVGDLGVMPSINKPINIHFLRRYHYFREQVETGEIKLIKVHTDDNLADPFTKALPRGMVIDHAKGIGLQLASSFMHTYD
nr:retrotransposon protein, putative, Ty1-copia subclass [Tanacetum cinerariifolium]